ncbi:MAG TPA: PQQ-binding-like beta-propeller repeat protein [Nitrososphaerales archaeon]|nr:PQQ-binding-like beta-propeller repeat protein [Nitrososphaerales archaeon]HUK74800.1 PQQ-binding-like beta-propeller repeat protein [Nitrososphaerales archaeon]
MTASGAAGLSRSVGLATACALLLLLATNSLVSAEPQGGDWTSLTYDNGNSRYQDASTVTAANAASLEQAWTFQTQFSISSTPTVSDGVVYFADWGGNVYAVNVADGSLDWESNLGAPISSTLLISDGMVYAEAGPTEAEVFALSQVSGAVVWSTAIHGTMPSSWTSPIEYNGLIYIGLASNGISENNRTQAGEIDAVSASTGQVVWRFVAGGTAGGAGIWGSPVVDPALGSIYIGTGNTFSNRGTSGNAYSIVSLNAMTGSLNWAHQFYKNLLTGRDNDFGSSGNLFSVTINGQTYQALGLGNKNGDYYVLDRTNGQVLRTYSVGTSLGGVIGLAGFFYLSQNNPEVFIPSAYNHKLTNRNYQGVVEALVPSTSTIAWKFLTPGNMLGSVALAPGLVIFGDAFGNVYALSTSNGKALWQTKLPYSVEGGVTIAEGHVLVGDFDNGGSSPTGLGLFAYVPSQELQ